MSVDCEIKSGFDRRMKPGTRRRGMDHESRRIKEDGKFSSYVDQYEQFWSDTSWLDK